MGMFVSDVLMAGPGNTAGPCTFATTAALGPDEDTLVTTPNNLEGLTCGSPPRKQEMPRARGIIFEPQCSSAPYMDYRAWARTSLVI